MDASLLVKDLRVSIPQAAGIGALALLLYGAVVAIYRLYFHPLSKFPGPRLHAISHLPFLYKEKISGTMTRSSTALHAKYGPIVRIAPNHIAVDGSIGWPQVFQRRANEPEFAKTPEFYQQGTAGILAAERESHRRQRRAVAHAFSAAALKDQEDYIRIHLEVFLRRLREYAARGEAVDMVRWYNFLTFDIIGELAFGNSFGCLEKSDYHPFVTMVFYSFKAVCTSFFLGSFGVLRPFLGFVFSGPELQRRAEMDEMALQTLEKRIALGADARRDFMTHLLRDQGAAGKGMSREETILNSRALIVAGSETTATAMSGLTFFLCREPAVYRKLTAEIRSAFASESDIDIRSTEALPYLHACIEEALRLYPPAAVTPPRKSPGDEIAGHYIPKDTLITIYMWATHRNPQNFADPEKFAPERWLPETHELYDARHAGDNRASFRPFSAGPRDCLGKNLAYAEMRLITARLLWNFDLAAVEGQDNWIALQKVFIIAEKQALMTKLTPAQRA